MVGMGNMGSALADAILASGLPLTVWNRSPAKCRSAVDAGANLSGSVLEGARDSDVIITCMTDCQSVHDTMVCDEVAEAMRGKVLVQLSQASPDESLVLADWAAANGIDYLDGSIMGLPTNVRANDCMIVYSGDRSAFNASLEVLSALGSKPRLVGEKPGIATSFDKAFFSAYYAHLVGIIHGAAMCQAAGAPLETYFELMIGGIDWTIPDRVSSDMIMSGDYSTGEVTMDVHAYAFGKVEPLCDAIGIDAALPRVIQNAFETAIRGGYQSDEIAALIEVFRKRV